MSMKTAIFIAKRCSNEVKRTQLYFLYRSEYVPKSTEISAFWHSSYYSRLVYVTTAFDVIAMHCIRGPRGILCTCGEKAHTSKRVSVIACNNAISKAQCAPWWQSPGRVTTLLRQNYKIKNNGCH